MAASVQVGSSRELSRRQGLYSCFLIGGLTVELFRVMLSRVGIAGLSSPELGLLLCWAENWVQQLGRLEYRSVGGTWQLEALRRGAWPLVCLVP